MNEPLTSEPVVPVVPRTEVVEINEGYALAVVVADLKEAIVEAEQGTLTAFRVAFDGGMVKFQTNDNAWGLWVGDEFGSVSPETVL